MFVRPCSMQRGWLRNQCIHWRPLQHEIPGGMGISPKTVAFLRALGHDAVHLHELGLERLPDSDIVARAEADGSVLLSHYPRCTPPVPDPAPAPITPSIRVCSGVERSKEPGHRLWPDMDRAATAPQRPPQPPSQRPATGTRPEKLCGTSLLVRSCCRGATGPARAGPTSGAGARWARAARVSHP